MLYGVGYCSDRSKGYSDTKDKCFRTWRNMLKRCYSHEEKYESYRELGTKVDSGWLDFVNFRSWFSENYYTVGEEQMDLDKDILFHGNQEYSSEKCIFIPKRINALFVKAKNRRGKYPIGVHRERNGLYVGSCSVNGENVKKEFSTERDAFLFYKKTKENAIKEIADLYKEKIPQKLYEALQTYEVVETD